MYNGLVQTYHNLRFLSITDGPLEPARHDGGKLTLQIRQQLIVDTARLFK